MDRIDRISGEMQRVISGIIREDLKDPRIPLMTSVMACKVTKDLKYAKIYISIMGDADAKKEAMKALKNSAGFVRREIAAKLNLRQTPELTFELDESIEKGAHLTALIEEAVKADEEGKDNV